jgi:hypothetical protein
MSGMTGVFTVEEKKQIAGQTTAPLAGATPVAGGAAPSGSSNPTKPTPSASGSGAKLAASPSPSAAQDNGAFSFGVSNKVIFGTLFAAVAALL